MGYPILKMLRAFQEQKTRFCMPGHKGRLSLSMKEGFATWDITELEGTDNLRLPKGCIAESEALAAAEQLAHRAFYGVNGSSGCLLAAFGYFREKDQVIVARDMHIAVENALLLSGVRPVYVGVSQTVGDIPQVPSLETFLQTMDRHPGARAVFFTYPNYYGNCTNAEQIAKAAHERGMLVVVDSAHGAHLPYSPDLPKSAGEIGADIWCTSFHKTLPALNQSAVLFCSKRVDGDRLREGMNRFQTTSPSYLLLASMDHARGYMQARGKAEIHRLLECLQTTAAKINSIPGMEVLRAHDPTKLIIRVAGAGWTGFAAASWLHQTGFEIEGADAENLLLITTVADRAEDFSRLVQALKRLGQGIALPQAREEYMLAGETELTLREAAAQETEWVPLASSAGRIAARSVFCYPPGVPILLSGQRICPGIPNLLASLADRGYNLFSANHTMLCVVR